MPSRTAHTIHFGDFQTPDDLAQQVVRLLPRFIPACRSIVEPTCGTGSFLSAAASAYREARIWGMEISADYVAAAQRRCEQEGISAYISAQNAFHFDWREFIRSIAEPVVIVGNPPWVTSAELGATEGTNLPAKQNFSNHRGIEAVTGKGNFDIAEWMFVRLIEAVAGRRATIALLVKTSVARRVLQFLWKNDVAVRKLQLFEIDSRRHFGISAAAGLLVCDFSSGPAATVCEVRRLDSPDALESTIGWRTGSLVADVTAYDETRDLIARTPDLRYRWRSGIKHDCAAVMELRRHSNGTLTTRDGEPVVLEADCVYPLVKGSDLANGRVDSPRRSVIVPQRRPGEDTHRLAHAAPRTWAYLTRHRHQLDARRSSIYRRRPPFSVFGVGPYTFAPWKVGVSALYKQSRFVVMPPFRGRPLVADDTVYHLSCDTEREARLLESLLNSRDASAFFRAFTFADAKRPLTVDVLQRLDLGKLAERAGCRLTPCDS